MVKLNRKLRFIRDEHYRGLCRMAFPLANHSFIERMGAFPGVRREKQTWYCPEELLDRAIKIAYECGIDFDGQGIQEQFRLLKHGVPNIKLYPFQVPAVQHALQHRSLLVAFETGLGKSVVASETARLAHAKKVLVVTPSNVKTDWQTALATWFPKAPEASLIHSAKSWADASTVAVTSYELAQGALKLPWDIIIADEVHYIKNARALRTKVLFKLARYNRSAIRLALSATPATNDPSDLHEILDWLWPTRFGSWFQFVSRYSVVTPHQYGTKVGGINSLHEQEFRSRIDACTMRATREEQAHLLPDLSIRVLRLDQKASGSQSFEDREDLSDLLKASAEQKVPQVLERVKSALASSASHVAVLTYHVPLANILADSLKGLGVPVVLVTGESTRTTKKRARVLDEARRADTCILVASMKAIGIGIDLTKFSRTLVAELYYSPAVVVQALGRFSRLSGKLPSQIDVLVFRDSAEEVCAAVLMEKLDSLSRTMKQTGVEKLFGNALDGDDDEAFFAHMQRVAAGRQDLLED